MTDMLVGGDAGVAGAGGVGCCCATALPAPQQRPIRQAQSAGLARLKPITTSTLEFCSETHPEELRLVKALTLDRHADIDPHRSHRRCPGHADAAGDAERRRVDDLWLNPAVCSQLRRAQNEVLLIVAPQCTKIGPNSPGNADTSR